MTPALDGDEPAALTDDPATLIDGVVWRRCTCAGHSLAPVGELTAKIAKTL